jgi:hypothetical protein
MTKDELEIVERIGQLPDSAIESERGKAWKEIPIVPLLCEMDDVGEQIPDPRVRAMAMVNIGFKRGYDSRNAEITQLKADLATAKQGLEYIAGNWECGHQGECRCLPDIAQQTLDKIGKE